MTRVESREDIARRERERERDTWRRRRVHPQISFTLATFHRNVVNSPTLATPFRRILDRVNDRTCVPLLFRHSTYDFRERIPCSLQRIKLLPATHSNLTVEISSIYLMFKNRQFIFEINFFNLIQNSKIICIAILLIKNVTNL